MPRWKNKTKPTTEGLLAESWNEQTPETIPDGQLFHELKNLAQGKPISPFSNVFSLQLMIGSDGLLE